jgi:hypothetical protein
MPSPTTGRIRILALSGGGIRGLLAAQALDFVEQTLGKPIWQCFDLVCGTSTGALMALALTKPGPLSAQQCAKLYWDYGRQIFSRSPWRAFHSANAMVSPKYDGVGFQQALKTVFASQTLEDALQATLAISYCLDTRQPVLHRSWHPPPSQRHLRDVAMASAAAPTYFPPAQLNQQWHVDGGTVCNNPSLTGLIEACKLYGAHTRDCVVLSVGTGLCKTNIRPKSALGWGKIGWVSPLIDIMLDGVPDLTDQQMKDLMPDGQYLHLESAISADLSALDNWNSANLGRLEAIGKKVIDSQKRSLLAILQQL